jgi:2-polyprenyl-3-methyl-5-hydroxy-6-metoxy-1,4-benzoquinol methylase
VDTRPQMAAIAQDDVRVRPPFLPPGANVLDGLTEGDFGRTGRRREARVERADRLPGQTVDEQLEELDGIEQARPRQARARPVEPELRRQRRNTPGSQYAHHLLRRAPDLACATEVLDRARRDDAVERVVFIPEVERVHVLDDEPARVPFAGRSKSVRITDHRGLGGVFPVARHEVEIGCEDTARAARKPEDRPLGPGSDTQDLGLRMEGSEIREGPQRHRHFPVLPVLAAGREVSAESLQMRRVDIANDLAQLAIVEVLELAELVVPKRSRRPRVLQPAGASLVQSPVVADESLTDPQEWHTFLHELRTRELRRLPPGAETVLSAGAAGSWYFEWFEANYPTPVRRHIAVEAFSPRPEELPDGVEWLDRSAGDLTPVGDAEVDLVYAGQTLEHLWPEDVVGFLLESHRTLKPGGAVVLDSPNRRVTTATHWLQPEHTVEFTVSEITELLTAAGFSEVRVRGVWLAYDAVQHRYLPLETVEQSGDWPAERRVSEAADRPEDSFIWWAEATKNGAAPTPPRVAQLTEAAYDTYRTLSFRRFDHPVGDLEREGDDVVVRSVSGEHGFLITGPRAPMPAGRWTGLFRVGTEHDATADPREPVARVDVTVGLEPRVVAERTLTQEELPPDGQLREVALRFELGRTEFGVQFRVETLGRVPVTARARADVEASSHTLGLTAVDAPSPPATTPVVEEPPSPARRGGALVAIGRVVLWPLKRFFDPRFGGIAEQIGVTHDQVVAQLGHANARLEEGSGRLGGLEHHIAELRGAVDAQLETATEVAALVGESLTDLRNAVEDAVEEIRQPGRARARALVGAPIEELDPDTAALLDYADSHTGFAAQRLLWFNWPISLRHEEGDVKLANVNERIVEVPFVLRALAALPPTAKILDVGATESTLAVSLAALGFDVTAIDPRPYPLSHPRLRTVVGELESWETGDVFDAVICLSTLEHIGLGGYGDELVEAGDRRALGWIHAHTAPGGMLVLTAPYGKASTDAFQRTYDRDGLERLLADWSVEDLRIAEHDGEFAWSVEHGDPDGDEGVALVIARRP